MINRIIKEVKEEIKVIEARIEGKLCAIEDELQEETVLELELQLEKLYEKLAYKKELLENYNHNMIMRNMRCYGMKGERDNERIRVHRVSIN